MNYIEVEGKTIESAVAKAAKTLDIDVEKIKYEIISSPSKNGFLKLLNFGTFKVKAFNSGIQTDQSQKEYCTSDVSERVKEFINHVLKWMVKESFKIEFSSEQEIDSYNIVNDEYYNIVNKKKKNLDALEHLVRKMVQNEFPYYLKKHSLLIDVNDIRKKKKQALFELAEDMKKRVLSMKQPIVLDNRTANERRIIHLALSQQEGVYTKSVGSGVNRKLMILPQKDQ